MPRTVDLIVKFQITIPDSAIEALGDPEALREVQRLMAEDWEFRGGEEDKAYFSDGNDIEHTALIKLITILWEDPETGEAL